MSGTVLLKDIDLLGEAEESDDDEEPDLPAWQKREWEIAKRIVSTDGFLRLPTKFEVHEWAIMRDFADAMGSGRIRDDLMNAVHGTHAFRRFKGALRRYRIEAEWFRFRTEALKQTAIDWCEEHQIRWR
jgi:hypothetical protein